MRVLVLTLVVGCTAAPRAPVMELPIAVREPERRAPGMMDAATEILDANVGGLVHLDLVRGHPRAWNITRLGGYDKFAEDAGLDAIFDVDRFFVSAIDLATCRQALVLRHHLPPARVAEVFATLAKNSKEPAARVTGLGVPAIAVRTRERQQVVLAPRPDHLVMIPRDVTELAGAFVRATPLPSSSNGEAWAGWGTEQGWPLLEAFVPGLVIPSASVTTYLGERHVMHVRAHARSAEQARTSAALLQRTTDAVLRMPIVGAMLFEPIEFRVVEDDVVTDISLSPSEHEWVLAQMSDGCW